MARSQIPKNVKQEFNGLAGYFRKLIPNFSQEMIPLYELTKSDAKWEWTDTHEAVRSRISDYLTSASLLIIFKESLPIELHTDASDGFRRSTYSDQKKTTTRCSLLQYENHED